MPKLEPNPMSTKNWTAAGVYAAETSAKWLDFPEPNGMENHHIIHLFGWVVETCCAMPLMESTGKIGARSHQDSRSSST